MAVWDIICGLGLAIDFTDDVGPESVVNNTDTHAISGGALRAAGHEYGPIRGRQYRGARACFVDIMATTAVVSRQLPLNFSSEGKLKTDTHTNETTDAGEYDGEVLTGAQFSEKTAFKNRRGKEITVRRSSLSSVGCCKATVPLRSFQG